MPAEEPISSSRQAGAGQPGAASSGPAPSASVSQPGGPSSAVGDLPVRAADAVDSALALAHDKVVRPLVLLARAVVFGLLIAGATGILLVVISVGLIRLLDVYAFPGRVWASYLLVGFVFAVTGLLLWSRRSARHGRADR